MSRPAEFYERLWQGGAGDENAARWSFQEGLVARALERLGDLSGGRRVLEIGPGVGHESSALVRCGAQVVALDLTAASLLRTRDATGGQALLLRGAAEALPLATASVDAVFAQTVLMHLDLDRAAAEWSRVLRRGGRVVIVEPLRGNPLVGLYRRLLSPYRATAPRYVTVADIRAAALPGLVLVHHEEHYVLAVASLALPRALRARGRALLEALDRRVLRLPGVARLAWMTLVELERVGATPEPGLAEHGAIDR